MAIDGAPVVRLPAREPRGHKGTFGTVCVVGGCVGGGGPTMLGGPALCGLAALRSGAGLVKLAMPRWLLPAALTIAPSATGVAIGDVGEVDADALVIGPGLGSGAGLVDLLAPLLAGEAPVVLDADGLNLLAAHAGALTMEAPMVLTPHVGEFRRLGEALGVVGPDPLEDPGGAARALAQVSGRTVVLKSSVTAVARDERVWLHEDPNPALATGGTGDVLAGVIGGLVAQFGPGREGGVSQTLGLFELACLGVLAHARAGRAWREARGVEAGMLAGELVDLLPGAIASLRS